MHTTDRISGRTDDTASKVTALDLCSKYSINILGQIHLTEGIHSTKIHSEFVMREYSVNAWKTIEGEYETNKKRTFCSFLVGFEQETSRVRGGRLRHGGLQTLESSCHFCIFFRKFPIEARHDQKHDFVG